MQVACHCRILAILVIGLMIAPAASAKDSFQEHWYKAAVNHIDSHLWVLLLTRDGHRYVRQLDLVFLGLPVPHAKTIRHASELYYPASSLKNISLYLNQRERRIYFVDHSRPEIATPPSHDLLLTVTIDGRRLRKPQYLRYANGQLLLPAETLKALRIKSKWQPPVSLHQLAGEFFSLDYRKLALNVVVPARLLEKSLLKIPRQPGLLATQVGSGEEGEPIPHIVGNHGLSAIVDFDVAAGYGFGSNYWHSGIYGAALGDSTTTCRTAYLDVAYKSSVRRLDSVCDFDWPDQMTSLSIGDATGGGEGITQPVRFGGIHIGTDFGLQPQFITLPFSRISGTARVPSTLEVWIDQMLALRTKVPAGPFEVQDIPLHTGAGELQATVISPTGERHVIESPFYADASLLAAGLYDWSVNAGKLRTDFATPADRYTDSFAAGHIRYGLTDGLTGSFGFQAAPDFDLASAGAAVKLGYFAVVDVAAGHSVSHNGTSGSSVQARLTHQGPHLSFSYQWQRRSRDYIELAWPTPGSAPETTRRLSLALPIGGEASLSVGEFSQHYFDGSSLQFQSASLGIRLGGWGYLLLSGFHLADGGSPWSYAAQLTVPFGTRSNISASADTDGNIQTERLNLQMNPPAGPGFGYRFEVGQTESVQSGQLDVQLQGDAAELDLDASKYGNGEGASARLAGSILLSGDGIGMSRRQTGSYAVVHVGAPDVPVYRGGQLAAYSDGDGDAVIGGLLPYEHNVISIQPDDVPINVRPAALEAVLIPGRREIMNASFGFEPVHYVTGKLKTAHGFVPRGASLAIGGAAANTVVGSDGRFFIAVPGSGNVAIEAAWAGETCGAVVKYNGNGSATVTDVGTLSCNGVRE